MLRSATAQHPSRQRSRLGNRPFALPGVDGNSAEARYFRDLCLQYATDLGDPTKLTEAELTLIRSAAALAVEAARLQARVVKGEPVDNEEFVRTSNSLARNLATLRRKAKPSPGGPDLQEYLRQKGEAA